MESILLRFCLAAVAVGSVLSAQESADGRLALVKNKELYIGKLDGSGLVQLTNDGVLKGNPHWSPDGRRLAYARQVDRSQSVAKIGLIDADGKDAREILFRPVGPQLIGGMRFVEESWWLNNDQLVLMGSVNPNNCEYVVIDVATGKELRAYIGACNSFVTSPNGRHLANFSPPGMGWAKDARRDYLELDDGTVYPADLSTASTVQFLSSEPQWSPDSSSIAVLEHDTKDGRNYAVAVTTAGAATRVPLLPSVEEPAAIRWVGNRLVVQAKGENYLIDLSAKDVSFAGLDVDDLLASEAEAKRSAEEARKRGIATAKRLGVTRDEDIDVFVPPAEEK
jgi:dipeptidyl aminopeptidase/acylaminoacyl peptidase